MLFGMAGCIASCQERFNRKFFKIDRWGQRWFAFRRFEVVGGLIEVEIKGFRHPSAGRLCKVRLSGLCSR